MNKKEKLNPKNRKNMPLYKVMCVTDIPEEHTTQISGHEADELVSRLERFFPEERFEIWPDAFREPKKVRYYNNNAVDGWEDMFPEH